MTKEFETARSGKTESIKEVLTRIQHARARNSYFLMIEDRDWLVVLQCMQDHHLFKSNPKRPPLSAFRQWLEKEEIEQYFAQCIVREMSDANKLINGEKIQIFNYGNCKRDFTYIDNVIEANLKACLASSEAAGEAYNIAYGGREYLIDIYYGLTKALGVDIEPNFGPDRKGDIKHSNADISKAKRLLGYDPDYSFQDGIKLAIEWYKENL